MIEVDTLINDFDVISNLLNATKDCYTQAKDDGLEDATWILTSAFIILTMQSGFGLLEAGMKKILCKL